jgi:2-oxoglutarate dehydrogenase E2 component (dihydrolipoamide succinyltransferase)
MDIKIPEIGESITEGTIASWLKKPGDPVKSGDLLLELETDKVNLEITAESNGVLGKILKQEGDTVNVGEIVGTIEAGVERSDSEVVQKLEPEQKLQPEQKLEPIIEAKPEKLEKAAVITEKAELSAKPLVTASSEHGPEKAVAASPSMRKLAREKGTEVDQAKAAPVDTAVEVTTAVSNQSSVSNPTPQEASDPMKPVQRQKMSRRRITIAKRLVEAQRTAAMLTTFNEVDMTAVLDIRKRRKTAFLEKYEVGLGFMSFFIKAVVGALKAFPMLNAEIDKEEIVLKQYYDIGIAVSAKEGLVVPVVRGVDRLTFAEIERQIVDLAAKARGNTLALADLQGGTFTITNGGVFGSLFSTPILNAPQVGILGMHTIQKRPIAVDDVKIEIRPMMYIALSYDHRIVDGSEAVRFLGIVKELLEDPESLLLEG